MKKGKEWLLREIRKLPCDVKRGHGKIKVVDILPLIEQLDEPEKVVIPQFVADYIEFCKGWNGDRQAYTEDNSGLWFALCDDSCGMSNSVSDWLFNEEKVEMFSRAWLDGYEIEKEKLYIVQLPTNLKDDLIILDADGDIWKDSWPSRYKMTEKRIKEIDERYWPFAKEVTE